LNATDAHITAAIQSGDRKQFELLFRDCYKPLCAFAYGFLRSKEESEEIVQSVFIHFWEKKGEISIDLSLKSYLYRSVRNAALNRLKHEKVKSQHVVFMKSQGEMVSMAVENMAEQELQTRIREALNKLPEQCRIVFELSRFEELKYAEIAERLGISVKTVENQMGKALRIMREQLHDYLPLIVLLLGGFLD
jgi:RNA polymerase sigma-70 factor (family 1)